MAHDHEIGCRCPDGVHGHDDEPLRVDVPAPSVPALGRVRAVVHHAPAPLAAPVVPARPWSEIDARHRDAIVGMLDAAAGHQRATARVQRAASTRPERIADTEARGAAYAAAVERLRDIEPSERELVATIREAVATHELLRTNLATYVGTYDRDAEAYDERAAACGTGPDHDRHRGNAERSRAAASLFRAVLALGTPRTSNVPHAESVGAGEEPVSP